MGAATFLSRVLGLIREIVFAGFLGQSFAASAFFYAFAIPNLFRRLLGEGALTAAFIPIFSKKLTQEGRESAEHAANVISTVLVLFCGGLTVAVVALLGVVKLLGLNEKWQVIFSLTQVMFPYMIMANLAALAMAILNVGGKFFTPAMSPVLLNIVMITSAFVSHKFFGDDLSMLVFGLAVGVVLGGILQWLYQLPSLARAGFPLRWELQPRDPVVKQVGTLMLPAVIGTAVYQVNVLVSGTLAIWVDDHARAALNYADRLMEFPMGIFGVSVATYALPAMARFVAENKMPEYKVALFTGLRMNFFLTIPSAVGLIVLAEPIVRLLFERGRFDASATANAAFALQFLALGLVAYSTVNILARAFYALHDTKTPMKISAVAMILNIPLTIWLMNLPIPFGSHTHTGTEGYGLRDTYYTTLGVGGIALANTVSSAFNAFVLLAVLRKRVGSFDGWRLILSAIKICVATALMAIVAYMSHLGLDGRFGHDTFGTRVITTLIPIALAVAAYFAAAAVLKVEEIHAIRSTLRRS